MDIFRLWIPPAVAYTFPASWCVYTRRVWIATVNTTTAFIYVHATELGYLLPALITQTVVTSGSIDAGGGIRTSMIENNFGLFTYNHVI